MRFVWPAQRYDALTCGAKFTAAVMTGVIGLALSVPIVTVYRATRRGPPTTIERRAESVTFVRPTEMRPRAVQSPSAFRPAPVTTRPATRSNLADRDTSSLKAPHVEARTGAAPARAATGELTTTSMVVGPIAAPVGFSRARSLTETQRDSALSQVAQSIPSFPWLPPTKEQQDSAERELNRRAAEARGQHRPLAIPLGGVSVTLPFGPSREQRARDSIVNADNLRRLARLAERARAKHDSLLGANALATRGRDTTHLRSDSSRLPRRDSVPNE